MPAKKKSPAQSKKEKLELFERFAIAYVTNGENASHAYLQIRPNVKFTTAGANGHRLLKNAEVSEFIAKERDRLKTKYALTADRVLAEHAKLAFFDPQKLVDEDGEPLPLHLVDADTAAALGAIELRTVEESGQGDDYKVTTKTHKFKPYSKPAVLAMINRILHLEEKPPEDPDTAPIDHMDLARRMAFRLAKSAKVLKATQAKNKKLAK